MPVRSLRSSVIRWPDQDHVDAAIRRWAAAVSRQRPEVVRIGYFGSYARGDWGVGSDLDIVVIVQETTQPAITRAANWNTAELPVPADVLVYTAGEWQRLLQQKSRFGATLAQETVWVYPG